MSTTKSYSKLLIGLAGECEVMKQLCLKGWVPSLAYNNSPQFDIFCFNPDKKQTITIQVKTIRDKTNRKVPAFPIMNNRDDRVDFYKKITGPYVLVHIDVNEKFRYFILSKNQFVEKSTKIEYDYDSILRTKPLKPGNPMAMPIKCLIEFEDQWHNLWSDSV